MKINATVKKWGNSYGVVLPKDVARNLQLKEGSAISLYLTPKKSIFGILKNELKGLDTQAALKKVDDAFEKN